MVNPYEGVSFSNQVIGISHAHCTSQSEFNTLYTAGVRHMAISNYYPSAPVYPLSGLFEDIPADAISAPNAEFARFVGVSGHIHLNGLGSLFSAGTAEDTSPGTTWQVFAKNMLDNLLFEDAGGMTINHPVWSGLTIRQAQQMLDFDSRVLGIEIYNHSCEVSNGTGYALDLWDSILSTGRRCWGFCVSDHGAQYSSQWPWRGFNVLLCDGTERGCLRACRTGAFYSRLENTALKFTGITLQNGSVSVTCENADTITFITNRGRTESSGNTASYRPTANDVFVRVEAAGGTDRIFSNPIMLKDFRKKTGTAQRILLF